MFTVISFILLLSLLAVVYFKAGGFESQLAGAKLRSAQALYCADSGIEWGRWYLNNPNNWQNWSHLPTSPNNKISDLGTFEVSFVCSTGKNRGTLTSTGVYSSITRHISSNVYFETPMSDYSAAIAATNSSPGGNGGEINIGRGMILDGRNHDINNPDHIIPGGAPAIAAAADINAGGGDDDDEGGTSKFGGTDQYGNDYAPNDLDTAKAEGIIKTRVNDMPTTPDGVAGFDKTLKQLAIENNAFYSGSGRYGPTTLKAGVNYIQLSSDGHPNDDDEDGNPGWIAPEWTDSNHPVLLVVHNNSNNATLLMSGKEIRGLVITDILGQKVNDDDDDDNNVRVNSKILGALVVLNRFKHGEGDEDDEGNGNISILYSRDLVSALLIKYKGVKVNRWSEVIR